MRREDFKIRVVSDSDAESMSSLARDADFTLRGVEIDWSKIAPYWLVVEAIGEIVGAIQICPGKPMGRIELLMVSPKLPWREQVHVKGLLIFGATSTLRLQGSQIASGAVTLSDTDTLAWMKKRGAAVIDTCHLVAWRLR